MTWADFMRTVLHRLDVRLSRHERLWQAADDFLRRLSFPPHDPIRSEVLRSLAQVRSFRQAVSEASKQLPKPYRPGVSPWKNSGLSARLKPDFQARGITDRE